MGNEDEIISLLGKDRKRYMDVLKTFEGIPEEYQILLVEHAKDRLMVNLELIHFFENKGFEIFYITANNPAAEVLENLKKRNINTDKLKIVDMITMSSEGTKVQENKVKYLHTPKDLIDLNEIIEEEIKGSGKKLIIIDSVTSLSVYNEIKTVEKFIHTVIARLRKTKVKGIMIAAKDTDKDLMAAMSQFCDDVLSV